MRIWHIERRNKREVSILEEIRTALVNESSSLSITLRKAKALTSETGLPEFRAWIDFELEGGQ